MSEKKKFITRHAKSSAALVSLGIHAVLIVVALSFVAVTVITKDDQVFEAKPVNRPKMQLKKLQVPVNIKKKKTQKPKLRKRIVVQPKLNQAIPDIKMPEITGVKGGIGSAVAGLGGAGSLGFSMPEINIFGIKGKGEKIFLILDSTAEMMYDEMGGIPAYTIIKEELVRIVEELPPTAIFNVAVFETRQTQTLFPNLVSANAANAATVKEWLAPLNAVSKGMSARDYGVKTLGKGGQVRSDDLRAGKFEEHDGIQPFWYRSGMLAMAQQADTIFLLSCKWGNFNVTVESNKEERDAWAQSSDGKKFAELNKKAQKMYAAENKARAAKGQPPRVLRGRALLNAYCPGAPVPPQPKRFSYIPEDFAEAFDEMQARNKSSRLPLKSGMGRKKKRSESGYSFNVVQFVKKGSGGNKDGRFSKLVDLCDGEYRTIAGMDAIESYLKGDLVD